MSRRRKHETPQHRKERERQRERAKAKRRAMRAVRMKRAFDLYASARKRRRGEVGVRLIWWHIPRSWARRVRQVVDQQLSWRKR